MESWKLLLVLGLTVNAVACLDLEEPAPRPVIVCHVSIYPEISAAIHEKLSDCDHVIVCYDGLCDLAKYFLNFSDASRIALIRSRAPHAKILRQVEVKVDENLDPILAVQNVEASLAGGLFDGAELVFDPAQLNTQGQIKYAQFLKMLKQNLDDHVLISNSFVCNQQLPAFLLNAMSEVLDYVILIPSPQNASVEGGALEPRVYSGAVANCLLSANFPRNKIVLGLPTGGKLVNSSVDREFPSNLIPYGNVCELHEEQQHCEEQQHQDCSLFEDGVKLVYDDTNSAGRRALQCVGCKLKGVCIALSYDDPAGICEGSSFPLLSAVQNVFKYRSGVLGFYGCPPDSEESDVGSNQEIQFDISSHSIENNQLDSDEEGAHGELCIGCPLRKRLQGTLKSSENVARMSKEVTEKVLGSLDRVVTLVSLMLQYRSTFPPVTRIPPSLEHINSPVKQPVQSDVANSVLQPGPDSVSTVEVGPIQQSRFDLKQTDAVDFPSGSEQEQAVDVDQEPQPEPGSAESNEENQNSPSGPVSSNTLEKNQNPASELNLEQNAEENIMNSPTEPPPEPDQDETDAEKHDLTSEPVIEPTNDKKLNQKLPTEINLHETNEENLEENNYSPDGEYYDYDQIVEENHNTSSGPDIEPIEEDDFSVQIGPDPDTDGMNQHQSSEQDSIITVEEIQSSRS